MTYGRKTSGYLIEQLGRNLRYGLRHLLRSPAFTIPAVASLALAIAVNTTMFSVVNALLLDAISESDDGRLVWIGRSQGGDGSFRSVSLAELEYLREHAESFRTIMGHGVDAIVVSDGENEPFRASAELVTSNYFALLGVSPAIGRAFVPDDERAAISGPVAVISDAVWRRHFAADPGVAGRTVRVVARTVTIVGVAPPGFTGTIRGVRTDLWFPPATANLVKPNAEGSYDLLVAQLEDGATIETARVELATLARRMQAEDPARNSERGFAITSARGSHPAVARAVSGFLALLMGVVAVVLLVACTNVAGLLLARASARRGELGTRLAIGASRGQLVSQLLTESFLLACAGAVTGLLLTAWAVRALNALTFIPGPTGPVYLGLTIDTRVLLFTAAATVLTTFAFGLLPAVQATRVDVLSALKDIASPFAGRSRLRNTLLTAQVALAVVFMVGATLLFRSARNSGALDLGFDPDSVVVASLNMTELGYDRDRAGTFFGELLRRVRAMPGIQHAALADFAPLGARGSRVPVTIAGTVDTHRQEVAYNGITEGFLASIRYPLARGRDVSASDRTPSPSVVIVNESLARRFWPGEEALGKRMRVGEEAVEREVIGVVRDARFTSYGEVAPLVLLPLPATYGRFLTLHVRTPLRPAEALAGIRRIARELDPGVPVSGETLRETTSFRLTGTRIAQSVFGIAGVIALLLAAGGLYGLVAYSAQQRMREIGIRVALGATRRAVFGVLVGGAARATLAGVAVGILLAMVTSRLIQSLLYGLSPTDPLTYIGVGALLLLMALAAGYSAARRGLRIDPVHVLRYE